MGKALRDRAGAAIIEDLIARGARELFDEIVREANHGDDFAYDLIYRLWRYGLTKSLLKELEWSVREIRFDSHPKLDPATDSFYWIREMPADQEVDPLAAYSLILVMAVNGGQAGQVKRCPGKKKVEGRTLTCGNFFVGADNKRYCSIKCASRARVQAKRKRDREGGMI